LPNAKKEMLLRSPHAKKHERAHMDPKYYLAGLAVTMAYETKETGKLTEQQNEVGIRIRCDRWDLSMHI
jgi:hypothetical protein